MPGLCSFNDIWLEQEKYKEWLQKNKLCKRKAFCTLCKKTINLASMGEGALTSHAKGYNHQQNTISAMMTYASSARHKYHAYLDKKKAEEKDEKKNPKGKKRELALDEVKELKAKKLRLDADIASLHASSVQKAEEAELKGLIVLVTESNALRRRAEEKMTVVASLSKMIEEKKKQIK